MSLEECLPAGLRGPSTTITRVAAGMSGAGVYRVEATGQTRILKVSSPDQPIEDWRRVVGAQRLAATVGLAPEVVHEDEGRRAVLSAYVADQSFRALYGHPDTRSRAVELLGAMLRQLHALPIPAGMTTADPRGFAATRWSGPLAGFAIPPFVREAVDRVLAAPPPADERPVLSHNDANPTNFMYDGERLLMLDWETAAPNHRFYDLGTVANFLRLNDEQVLALLSAYGEPVPAVPEAFVYHRRLAAALIGGLFLYLARYGGHAGATGGETADGIEPLERVYAALRDGSLSVATAEGQWRFGLAMVKDGCGF